MTTHLDRLVALFRPSGPPLAATVTPDGTHVVTSVPHPRVRAELDRVALDERVHRLAADVAELHAQADARAARVAELTDRPPEMPRGWCFADFRTDLETP